MVRIGITLGDPRGIGPEVVQAALGEPSLAGRASFIVLGWEGALPDRLPVALVLPVNRRLEMAFWLYWRIYEMKIPFAGFRELFGRELQEVYGGLLGLWERMGLLDRLDGSYHVTESGAYWIHRIQNEYALNYINRLWGRCRSEAWPTEVTL